ncbi:MAG: hypothetical protein KDI37_12260, partial [Xanthomonadales bacterium]|nr:hypothetical protein [Xanthomonadales bacterium]
RMVPKPLRAILLKATASDREARYESAAALAEDLRRWRSGHPVVALGGGRAYAIACFLRRHRWTSAAAGIALLALLGGIGVALYGLGQARQAQTLAEQRRVQAEGLVGVMLGDLADKLRPLGRLDLLETVGDEAMRYLSAASTSSDAGIGAIQRARALRTLGEVYVQRQQTEQAGQAFAEAERTLQQASSDPADLTDLLFEQGNVAYWLGYLDLQANDLAGAGQHFGDYLVHAEALQAITTESGLGLLETSYALNNLGTVASRRDQNAEAIDYYERSVALKRRYLESHPDDDNVRVDLADSLSWIGSALASERKPSVARAYFEQQLELTSAIRSARTGESWWIWKEAVATHILARLQVSMGDKAAIDRLAAALDGYAAASRTDPSNRRWAEQVISAQIDVAWATAVLANTASGLSELQAIEQRLKSSAAAGTTDRNLLRVESRLSLLRALDSDCPTEERDRSAGVQSSSDEAPRDLALLLVARGLCSSEVERSQSFQAAEALAELPELRRGDDGLQIKALIAAAEKNKIELSRLTAELERLGYDAERAIRLTRATDSPR